MGKKQKGSEGRQRWSSKESLPLSPFRAWASGLAGPGSESPNQKQLPPSALKIGPVKSSHLTATLKRGWSVPVMLFFTFSPFYSSLKYPCFPEMAREPPEKSLMEYSSLRFVGGVGKTLGLAHGVLCPGMRGGGQRSPEKEGWTWQRRGAGP